MYEYTVQNIMHDWPSTNKCSKFSYMSFRFKSIVLPVCHQVFQTFLKGRHFQTEAAIENRLALLCSIIIAGYPTQILYR